MLIKSQLKIKANAMIFGLSSRQGMTHIHSHSSWTTQDLESPLLLGLGCCNSRSIFQWRNLICNYNIVEGIYWELLAWWKALCPDQKTASWYIKGTENNSQANPFYVEYNSLTLMRLYEAFISHLLTCLWKQIFLAMLQRTSCQLLPLYAVQIYMPYLCPICCSDLSKLQSFVNSSKKIMNQSLSHHQDIL